MIRIVKDGQDLDLGEANVRWESINTLFEDNSLQADYSFPFIIPLSDPNTKALGFINKHDVPKSSVRFPVTFFLGDTSLSAILIVNGCTYRGFSINVTGGFTGLVNAEKKLSELNLGADITIPDLTDLSEYKTINWKNIIAFPPHYNPDFYGDNNPDFNGVINRQNADTGQHLMNDAVVLNKYALVPWMYLFHVLKAIFDENGLTPTGTFWNNPEMSAILLYNNYALDAPTGSGVTVFVETDYPVYHTTPFDDLPVRFLNSGPGAIDDDSNWDNSGFFYLVPVTADYICEIDLIIKLDSPQYAYAGITVNTIESPQLLTPVFANTVFHLKGSFLRSVTAGDEIYGNLFFADNDDLNYTILKGSSFKIYRADEFVLNTFSNTVTLKNHVPDITVTDLLKELKNLPQMVMNFDWQNKLAKFDLVDRILSSPPEVDLTSLADPYPEQVFDDAKKGYVLYYDFGTQDELVNSSVSSFRHDKIELVTDIPYIDPEKIIGEVNSPGDLVAPAQLGDFVVIKSRNHIMRAEFISGSNKWEYYCDNYLPVYVPGSDPVDRPIKLAPILLTQLAHNENSLGADVVALMPTIREQGSSPMFNMGINAPSLRIAFMRGENIDPGFGGIYISASTSNYDLNGNNLGSYNFKFHGADNWYSTFLEKILLAINASEVFEYLVALPISYLKYKGKVQIKNVNFLIKTISMPLTIRAVKQSVVKLLKL